MWNVAVAFEVMEDDKIQPKGYKLASCHIIFDVKMDFTRKAQYNINICAGDILSIRTEFRILLYS